MRKHEPFSEWRAHGWRIYLGLTHSPGHLLAHNPGIGISVSADSREELLQKLEERNQMDIDAYLAASKERVRLVNERAGVALGRPLGTSGTSRRSLTDGLTAEQIEKDAKALKNILRAWKRKRLRYWKGVSHITLPSGRKLGYDWENERLIQK
jgi:hypothetical protein